MKKLLLLATLLLAACGRYSAPVSYLESMSVTQTDTLRRGKTVRTFTYRTEWNVPTASDSVRFLKVRY